jgi:DNA polymerase-3 subunit gamma/tau
MSFVVSARKYRPIRFKDVIGQPAITTTLKNALKSDKLAQSFLFCGPRGVGKTTCARILAKIINCQNLSDDIEPCNECAACKAFNHSASFNIFELDAASNNSVDDIRALIEQVRFAPQVGKYKVYIIDEVHMLSQAAFNAFLKTLEEPPSYAIFILATTEKHKIIPTILSRCQIFDFSRIKISDIVSHLQGICRDQNVTADDDALHIIAEKADGGMRDALSMFDRIAGYSNGNITYQSVLDTLSILDYDYYFQLTEALLLQDTGKVLLLLDEILQRGFEGDNLMDGMSGHFRNLLVCKDPNTLRLLEASDNLRQLYAIQAAITPGAFLLSALNLANQCDIQYKQTRNKRLLIELTLLKMCYMNSIIDLAKLQVSGNLPPNISTKAESGSNLLSHSQAQNNNGANIQNSASNNIVANKQATEQDNKQSTNEVKPIINPLDKLKSLQSDNPFAPSEKNISLQQNKAAITTDKVSPNTDETITQLSTDLLQKAWKAYCAQISPANRAILENCPITLLQNKINLTLYSDMQESLVRDDSIAFLTYLQQQYGLQGYELQRHIDRSRVQEQEAPKPAVFMSSDQLKEMEQKNPYLAKFQQRLGLDLD